MTAIAVFERGPAVQRAAVSRGRGRRSSGDCRVQVGDRIGERAGGRRRLSSRRRRWNRSSSEPIRATGGRLRDALAQLAEQDPLINVRQDDDRHELSVSLYGEVQKEVIAVDARDGLRRRRGLPRGDDDLHRASCRNR